MIDGVANSETSLLLSSERPRRNCDAELGHIVALGLRRAAAKTERRIEFPGPPIP